MTHAIQELTDHLARHTGQVVLGADAVLRHLLVALIARGHVLIEGPPGLGKTLLAKCMARQLGGQYKRIQCTPDLMPSDLTGVHMPRGGSHEFEFVPGPLFADVVLVDELNRTGPRTQAALLEAMEERHITVDRKTYPLPDDFLVIATQNPHEFEGTYPLPESQLDRFLLRLRMAHPAPAVETQILREYGSVADSREARIAGLPVIDRALLQRARAESEAVTVSGAIHEYVTAIAAATRADAQIALGISTRGALALLRSARVEAALSGSAFVTPDHVKALAVPVLAHRLLPSPEATLEGVDATALIGALLGKVAVPRESPAQSPAA